ncbi:hypothetical protein HB779_05355 [Phyllobacterium sp. 628]|uniref:hypothetical protein n=1 Tax=Phyllobacterium sp. 628 TaxID=2718938 RepID=UPI0016624E1A|nr:hypothetical protein [Phyllobacterium sp. 628]QND51390.1 hypothetical protein HB779_05355 [Phyllobacterium sp. 628]
MNSAADIAVIGLGSKELTMAGSALVSAAGTTDHTPFLAAAGADIAAAVVVNAEQTKAVLFVEHGSFMN